MADLRDYKALFNQSGIRKQLHISFLKSSIVLNDEDIVSESMEISESLCSGTELRFGSCEASVFKLRSIGNVVPLIGENFTVSMYVGDIEETFVLGTYKVTSDKPTADRRYRDIVAHDAMYDIIKADVTAWYNGILPNKDSKITLRKFRDSFADHFSIEQEEITLPNDEMIVERTIEPEVISGKDVLTAICEINGCFGHIGRNGKMQYITLSGDITDELSKEKYISCKYEEFVTKQIGKLQIRQEENDIGCIIGEGENCYIVQNNFLVYGKGTAALETIGQNLFNTISGVCYRPATVKAIGNPCLEVGTGIRVITQYETVETYILERTIKGIHALSDSYEAEGVESYSEAVNGANVDILQLKGKTNKLIRTVDELSSTIEDEENGLKSQIKQTADKIKLKVSKDSVISEINQSAEEIQIKAEKLDLQGLVTITDLETEGATKINGANIETGTIAAEAISADFFTTASQDAGWTIMGHPTDETAAYICGNNSKENNVVLKTGGDVAFACGMEGYYPGDPTTGATVQIWHNGNIQCERVNWGIPITDLNIGDYVDTSGGGGSGGDVANGAGAHNAVYRGSFLGTAVTSEQYAAIANGTFSGLFIGDYWTINGIKYRIAAFDYYLNTGDYDGEGTFCTTHHVTIVPDAVLYNHIMNESPGVGYGNSAMRTTGLEQAKNIIYSAFSEGHILKYRNYLENAIGNNVSQGISWYDCDIELMSEQNVYGSLQFGNSANRGTVPPYNYAIDCSQFPLFFYRHDLIWVGAHYWLRNIATGSYFCHVHSYGVSGVTGPTQQFGIRPAFSIIG